MTLRWGILGTGNIARQFAAGVRSAARSKLAAVASRSEQSARDFAAQFQIGTTYGSYDAILADRDVDAIYISLPNSLHCQWTIRSLAAGKHVLCEKPFAMNAAESQEMFDASRRAGKVLIEAFMYRAHPQTHAVVEAVRSGKIGELKLIRTSFCYRTTKIDGNVRFARELGGGALMDVGCYCLNFSQLIAAAAPAAVHAVATFHETGVDEMTSAVLQFPSGVSATFTCGMGVQADNAAYICGTDGYLQLDWPWKPQPGKSGFVIARGIPPRQDQASARATDAKPQATAAAPPREAIDVPVDRELYAIEADAFATCVLDDAAPFVSRDETLTTMRLLDEIRRQIGLSFE